MGDDDGRRDNGHTWAHMLGNNIGQNEIHRWGEGDEEEAKEEGDI